MRCIRLGDAALGYGNRATPGALALAAAYTARGYARLKNTEVVRRLLDEADRLASAAASHPEDEPDYLSVLVPVTAPGNRGVVTIAGGKDALASLTVAIRGVPVSFKRDRIEYSACLARAHAQLGDAERAEDVAVRTAELSADVPWARAELVRAASMMRARLPRRGRCVMPWPPALHAPSGTAAASRCAVRGRLGSCWPVTGCAMAWLIRQRRAWQRRLRWSCSGQRT